MPSLIEPVVAPGTLRELGAQPTMHVDELTLRPWRHDDADDVVAAYSDPAIRQWHTRSVEPDEAIAWIDRNNERWAAERGAAWAVTVDERLVGRVAFRVMELAHGWAELAYWVTKAGRGNSVAPRAVATVTDWALELGLHRLEIRHSTANLGSCRVAAKAGYPLEATQRSAQLHADGWHDMHVHAKVAA